MPAWTRAQFEAGPRTLLSRGSRLKPAVWRLESAPGGPVVVKDAAGAPWWSRWLARALLARERRVLENLRGLEQVPELLGSIDAEAFVCRWLAGAPLQREAFQRAPRRVADELLLLVERFHARAVYHLDLRQRQNVLLDARGTVAVVDFGAAWRLGPLTRPWLGPCLAAIDRQAALKYLARYAPEQLSAAEARAVLRAERWRRFWPFTPHRSRGAAEGARERLRQLESAENSWHNP